VRLRFLVATLTLIKLRGSMLPMALREVTGYQLSLPT